MAIPSFFRRNRNNNPYAEMSNTNLIRVANSKSQGVRTKSNVNHMRKIMNALKTRAFTPNQSAQVAMILRRVARMG